MPATAAGLAPRPLTMEESMPYIDWSDSEDMFGLLLEFVADARAESEGEPRRQRFLSGLLRALRALGAQVAELPTSATLQQLRDILEGSDAEFAEEPAVMHLQDLIEELERLEGAASPSGRRQGGV